MFFVDLDKVFPDSFVGKESAYNAGDPGFIPGLGRSSEKGKGNPLQYLCPRKAGGLQSMEP